MRKRWMLLVLATVSGGFLFAEVDRTRVGGKLDPSRGKEKESAEGKDEKPEPEMGKPGGPDIGRDEHEAIHQRLEAEGRENLKEIARLMEKVRNDLAQKKTGDATQGQEREVVKKIQDLIEKLEKG